MKKHIDVSETLRTSNSRFLRRIPRQMARLLEWVVCQDRMNETIERHLDASGFDFHARIIKEFNLTIDVQGQANLPEQPRCFFVANHPFGVIDGLALTYCVGKKYGALKAIGNDAFLYIPALRPLIAAVNVYGRSSKDYVRALDEVFCSEVAITHFPAGEVSRFYHGRVQDGPWQKSFITKAIMAKRDVVPCHFAGSNSRLFLLIFRLRRRLGIKLNLELALLPREMFRKANQTIRLMVGRPIPWQTFDHSRSHHEWAQLVRHHVYRMGTTGPDLEFTPSTQ